MADQSHRMVLAILSNLTRLPANQRNAMLQRAGQLAAKRGEPGLTPTMRQVVRQKQKGK